MGTFLEIFFTSLLTFIAGILCVKYQPKPNKKRKFGEPIHVTRREKMKSLYRDNSPRFILMLCIAMILFTCVLYLLDRGYIILKW